MVRHPLAETPLLFFKNLYNLNLRNVKGYVIEENLPLTARSVVPPQCSPQGDMGPPSHQAQLWPAL